MELAGVPNSPGVYAVFTLRGDCLYVGASRRVLDRVMNHWRKHWGRGGKLVWVATGRDFLHEADHPTAPDRAVLKVWPSCAEKLRDEQTRMIEKLRPQHNARLD